MLILGGLVILEVWKGGPEKKNANFTPKIQSIWFSVGLIDTYFLGKKGALEFLHWKFIASGLPLQVFVNGPLPYAWKIC